MSHAGLILKPLAEARIAHMAQLADEPSAVYRLAGTNLSQDLTDSMRKVPEPVAVI